MKLILNGDAKNKHESRQGIYILGQKLVNNHPYWEQQDGSNAIWFRDTYRQWYIGPKESLGEGFSFIVGPKSEERSPTQISNGWVYYGNGLWIIATASDIIFIDLTPGSSLL